jgi:hypothetical protein
MNQRHADPQNYNIYQRVSRNIEVILLADPWIYIHRAFLGGRPDRIQAW